MRSPLPFTNVLCPAILNEEKKRRCANGRGGSSTKNMDSCEYQRAVTYNAYAKELCEKYNFDWNKYRLCVKEQRYITITLNEFAVLKENLWFLDNTMKTVLAEYQNYFQKRFVEGLSIRKYVEAHQLNRGSVDYLQKKFFLLWPNP